MKGACFSDEEREKMYAETLSYYITNLLPQNENQRIVFAENSGWNMQRIIQKLPEYDKAKIEFISLKPEEFDISKGKGYNELLMINKAIEKSQFVKEAGAFFKVTGRYPIYNIGYFLKDASKRIYRDGIEFYCDIKDHKLYDWLRLGWCGHSFEARLWGVSTNFYLTHLAQLYKECDDYNDRLVEGVAFDFIKNNPTKNIALRFKREPQFGGLEGSVIDAVSFSADHNSFKSKLKIFVGNTIRVLIPWFKF